MILTVVNRGVGIPIYLLPIQFDLQAQGIDVESILICSRKKLFLIRNGQPRSMSQNGLNSVVFQTPRGIAVESEVYTKFCVELAGALSCHLDNLHCGQQNTAIGNIAVDARIIICCELRIIIVNGKV